MGAAQSDCGAASDAADAATGPRQGRAPQSRRPKKGSHGDCEYECALAVACVFRNAAFYLPEWLALHQMLGVERFYLANHLSEDDFMPVLAPYVASGKVRLTHITREFTGDRFEQDIHVPFFNSVISECCGRVRWLACIDADEFLLPVRDGDRSILDVLRRPALQAAGVGGVCANWQTYGTSGFARIPPGKLLVETLIRKAPVNHPNNLYIKWILRPERVRRLLDPHVPEFYAGYYGVRPSGALWDPQSAAVVDIDDLRINHYTTGDAAYFERYKVPFYRRYLSGSLRDKMEQVCGRARRGDFNDVFDPAPMARFARALRRRLFHMTSGAGAEGGRVPMARVCVMMHIGNYDRWPFYRRYLRNVSEAGIPYDLYVTVHDHVWSPALVADVHRLHAALPADDGDGAASSAGDAAAPAPAPAPAPPGVSLLSPLYSEVIPMPNRGLDVGGWLVSLYSIFNQVQTRNGAEEREEGAIDDSTADHTPVWMRYDLMLKVHTKNFDSAHKHDWCRALMNAVAGTPQRVRACVRLFATDPSIGMLGARAWHIFERYRADVQAMAQRMGLPTQPQQGSKFIGGTIFWARFPLLAAAFAGKDIRQLINLFPPGYPLDLFGRNTDSAAHFVERIFGNLIYIAGFRIVGLPSFPDRSIDHSWDEQQQQQQRQTQHAVGAPANAGLQCRSPANHLHQHQTPGDPPASAPATAAAPATPAPAPAFPRQHRLCRLLSLAPAAADHALGSVAYAHTCVKCVPRVGCASPATAHVARASCLPCQPVLSTQAISTW
jgi:hypothetical protein